MQYEQLVIKSISDCDTTSQASQISPSDRATFLLPQKRFLLA
jgi:hypothetical protein